MTATCEGECRAGDELSVNTISTVDRLRLQFVDTLNDVPNPDSLLRALVSLPDTAHPSRLCTALLKRRSSETACTPT